VLHEKVVLMTVQAVEIPQVAQADRVTVAVRGEGIYQVVAKYGFLESPNVTEILALITDQLHEERADAMPSLRMSEITFYLGRETLIVMPRARGVQRPAGTMPGWRARLFGVMSRNAQSATAYFGLPPNRVVELGAQIQV
jgi:KUP system potassium uptake protein